MDRKKWITSPESGPAFETVEDSPIDVARHRNGAALDGGMLRRRQVRGPEVETVEDSAIDFASHRNGAVLDGGRGRRRCTVHDSVSRGATQLAGGTPPRSISGQGSLVREEENAFSLANVMDVVEILENEEETVSGMPDDVQVEFVDEDLDEGEPWF